MEKQALFDMKPETLRTIITLGAPLALGAMGAGIAAYKHNRGTERQTENLRAAGRDMVRADVWGKRLPVAQERFTQLAEIAPNTMLHKHMAIPLLNAAVSGGDRTFMDVAERATNIERNLSVTRPSVDLGETFRKGFSVGATLGPAFVDIAGVSPTQQSGIPQELAERINGKLIIDPEHLKIFAMTSLVSEGHEAFKINEDMLNKRMEELTQKPSKFVEWSQHIFADAQRAQSNANAGHKKHSSADLMKLASPEALGEALATQYLMANSACSMYKLAFEFSPTFKNALMAAGTAALGAIATVGLDKGFDAWQNYKNEAQFDNSYNVAIKRLQKGVAGDPYFESVRTKIEEDPVRYKQMAREAFDLLAATSPHMAKHPIVAKSFIARVLHNEGELPREEMNVYSRIRDPMEAMKPISERLTSGFRAFGGEAAFSAAAQEAVRKPTHDADQIWQGAENEKGRALQRELNQDKINAQKEMELSKQKFQVDRYGIEHKDRVADDMNMLRARTIVDRQDARTNRGFQLARDQYGHMLHNIDPNAQYTATAVARERKRLEKKYG